MTYEYAEQVAPRFKPGTSRAALFKCYIDPSAGFESGTVIAITFPQYCFSCSITDHRAGAPMLMRTVTDASRRANSKNILLGDKTEYYCMTCLDDGRVAGVARRRWVLVED